jgi:hypothetical protein
MSIAKNKESEAQIMGLFEKVPMQTHHLERELDIAMAGAAAEEKFTGKKSQDGAAMITYML